MQTQKDNQISGSNDPEWYLLAETSLSELLLNEDVGDELTAGMLFQAAQGIGMPPEFLQSIGRTLIEFAREAMVHFSQDRLDLPVYIRLFYQKKTLEDLNSANSSGQFNAELLIEPKQIIYQSDAGINGGWGYFLIERGGDFLPGSSVSTCNWIDLYLYKEGE